MKMDGRDSAECQNWEKRDIIGINGIVKLEKDKTQIVFVCYLMKRSKNVKWGGERTSSRFPLVLE